MPSERGPVERGVWSGHCRVEAIPAGSSDLQLEGLRLSLDLRLTPGRELAAETPRSTRGQPRQRRWLAGLLLPLAALLVWWWMGAARKVPLAPVPKASQPAVARLPSLPPVAAGTAELPAAPLPAADADAPLAGKATPASSPTLPRAPTIRPLTEALLPPATSQGAPTPARQLPSGKELRPARTLAPTTATARPARAPERSAEFAPPAPPGSSRADRLDLFGDTK